MGARAMFRSCVTGAIDEVESTRPRGATCAEGGRNAVRPEGERRTRDWTVRGRERRCLRGSD